MVNILADQQNYFFSEKINECSKNIDLSTSRNILKKPFKGNATFLYFHPIKMVLKLSQNCLLAIVLRVIIEYSWSTINV